MHNMTSYSCSATKISYKGDDISHVSRAVFKICRGTDRRQTDRLTDDRRGDRNTRLSHCKCASLISTNTWQF